MDEEIKILCVDDEKNVLKALERLFLDNDYEIITASSGEEGLTVLENTEPVQIIISDYRMPGMNGVDFLKEVYKVRPDTMRIVLSGYADTAAIVGAINEGRIYKFIPKPWNDDELKVAISNAIDRYFIHKKNMELTKELKLKNNKLQEINDNLENLVEKRTADLEMRNRILVGSQNILNSLPAAVIGLDSGGLIVQCNTKALELFGNDNNNLIGTDSTSLFPDELINFIEKVADKETCSAQFSISNSDIRVKAIHMNYHHEQEGTILVFDEVTANE